MTNISSTGNNIGLNSISIKQNKNNAVKTDANYRNENNVTSYNNLQANRATEVCLGTNPINKQEVIKNYIQTYLLDKNNFSKITQNKQIYIPQSIGKPSLNTIASYLAYRRDSNQNNGFVIFADDVFCKEYNSNSEFREEIDNHLKVNNQDTIIYDFRTEQNSPFYIGNKELKRVPFLQSQKDNKLINETGTLNTLGKLNEQGKEKIKNVIEQIILDEGIKKNVFDFLEQNITVDTFKTETILMRSITSQMKKNGIDVKDDNTYFFVPREKNKPKSYDRIAYTYANEMGIDNSKLISEVKDIPKGANVVCLDDFAGSGNSFVKVFSNIIENQNVNSITFAPLTSTKASKEFWNKDGSFNVEKLLNKWNEAETNKQRKDIVNQIQAAEALTLFQMLKTDERQDKIKEILSVSFNEKGMDENITNKVFETLNKVGRINYVTARKTENVFASEYYNQLKEEDKNKLLKGLCFSSIASLLGYGQSATTYIGPVMATNTNVGIMSQISEAIGIKSKKIPSAGKILTSEILSNVKITDNKTGFLKLNAGLFCDNNTYCEYDGKKYDFKTSNSLYKVESNGEEYCVVIETENDKSKITKINGDGTLSVIPCDDLIYEENKIKSGKNNIEMGIIETNYSQIKFKNGENELTFYIDTDGNSDIVTDDDNILPLECICDNGSDIVYQIA